VSDETLPDETPGPARSRVNLWTNKEGARSWQVSVVAGDTREELDDALTRAIELDQLLEERYAHA
jgi:hypothetical protein